MFRKNLVVIMLLMFAMMTNAQQVKIGAVAGYNINSPSGENGQSSHSGFDVGVKAELGLSSISKGWYADFGMLLSLKGTKSDGNYYPNPNRASGRADVGEGDIATSYKLNYNSYWLTIPLHIGYKFEVSDNLRLFVNGGPYMGIGLFGKLKGTSVPEHTKTTLSDNVYGDDFVNRFDWGIGGKIGAEFARHYQVAIGYDHGIKSLKTDKNPIDRKNRTFNISLAYMF